MTGGSFGDILCSSKHYTYKLDRIHVVDEFPASWGRLLLFCMRHVEAQRGSWLALIQWHFIML
jgi:hypothetical protein